MHTYTQRCSTYVHTHKRHAHDTCTRNDRHTWSTGAGNCVRVLSLDAVEAVIDEVDAGVAVLALAARG